MSFLRIGLLTVLMSLPPFAASGYESRWVPLDPALLQHRFPQHLVTAHCDRLSFSQELTTIGKGRTRLHTDKEGLVVLDGTTIGGRPWEVVLGVMYHFGGCAAWSGDFGRDGTEDLVFLTDNGANGIAPDRELLFVMFDETGLPIPWRIIGYFEADKAGIEDLLETDPSGPAVLVQMDFFRIGVGPIATQSYWGTTAYAPSAGQWNRVDSMSGVRLPLFTRFTYRRNHVPVTPPRLVPLFDYSRGLAKKMPIVVTTNGDIRLDGGASCSPLVAVFDTPGGLQAFGFPGRSPDAFTAVMKQVLRTGGTGEVAIAKDDEGRQDCTFLHATTAVPRK
jgi:hypothetical protein